jgi:protein-S-isoprenylcysteine O-methyltransferase Ste14
VKRALFLIYGSISYVIFLAVFLYNAAFLANAIVPKTIDSGTPSSLGEALLVNLALLAAFALQHSGMARPAFKRWLTRVVAEPIERATYVLASSVLFIGLFYLWRPMPELVFQIEAPALRLAMWGLFIVGVLTVLYSTFLIDHFDLFGLRQVVLYFRGKEYESKRFSHPSLYRFVRHPLYVGWFITFWATPDMTQAHLLLAIVTSVYILIAIPLEERDLLNILGDDYGEWHERTPMLIPFTGATRRARGRPARSRSIH